MRRSLSRHRLGNAVLLALRDYKNPRLPNPPHLAMDTGAVGGDRRDFFVSHAGADRAWAEWVAWPLEQPGFSVEPDVCDWCGPECRDAMSGALDRCDRAAAVLVCLL